MLAHQASGAGQHGKTAPGEPSGSIRTGQDMAARRLYTAEMFPEAKHNRQMITASQLTSPASS